MSRHLFIRLIKKLLPIYFFQKRFQKPSHSYPTRFSEPNYVQPIYNIKMSQYSISIRGPYIWNSFLSSDKKQITTMHNLKL